MCVQATDRREVIEGSNQHFFSNGHRKYKQTHTFETEEVRAKLWNFLTKCDVSVLKNEMSPPADMLSDLR